MIRKILSFVPGVIVPMGINFLLTILYAQFLSPGEYGILNIYLNSILIVYAISGSVFQTASLRFYTIRESYENESSFISSYLFGNLAATLTIIPFSLIINIFLEFDWEIIVLSVGANSIFQFICNLYRLKNYSFLYNFSRCVTAVSSIILLFLFSYIIDPLTYVWPIIAVYGSYFLFVLFEIFMLRKQISLSKISFSLLKESIKYGFPLIGVSVFGYIISSCAQYFILYYFDKSAVGNYSLGFRLVDALVINMLTMVLLVMTPELNKQHDYHGEKVSSVTLMKMISAAMWIIMPICFAIIVYADYIILFIFPEYESAAHIMRLVVFASIFHGISMFTCKGLELVKHPKFVFYSLGVSTLFNCLYNAIFLPIYGLDAAANGSFLTYVLYNVLLILFTRKYFDLKIDYRYIFKTTIVTLITLVVAVCMMSFFPVSSLLILMIECLICVFTYLIFSFIFNLYFVFK